MGLKLRDREAELIRLLASGHCQQSAAATMGIKVQVVKNMMHFARNRNRMNSYELVAHLAVQDFLSRTIPTGEDR